MDVPQKYLIDKNPEPTQVVWAWKEENLVASRMPFIGFVYDGIADDKVGITTGMAKALNTNANISSLPSGITALRIPAPAVICFPASVPRRDGSRPYCEKKSPRFYGSAHDLDACVD